MAHTEGAEEAFRKEPEEGKGTEADAVESFRKESEERQGTHAKAVNVIGPVDPKPAPDHQCQQGKVDPMAPADCQGVFQSYLQPLHSDSPSRKLGMILALFILVIPIQRSVIPKVRQIPF